MGETTGIQWTNATWNPWHGCRKVSPACAHCYMFREKKQYGQDPELVVRSKTKFREPLKWKEPALVFTCSWSDWFIEEADAWRDDAWGIIRSTPHLTYQILTKRPDRIAGHLPPDWPLKNVWLGVSVENQKFADLRIPQLLAISAAVRFLSVEPMLGPIEFSDVSRRADAVEQLGRRALAGIDWMIAGGESGPRARPTHPDWVRSLRDQCVATGVPFFFKQWGEWMPVFDRDIEDPDWRNLPHVKDSEQWLNLAGGQGFHGERVVLMRRVGKHKAGALLDGREWLQFPEVRT